ncbi:MAG: leucyl aminopeptidase [Bordetella sp.]|nr:MAG: leucyl aminopeptidase [Bordetella sp.]
MELNTKICIHPNEIKTEALGIGIYADGFLTKIADLLDQASNGFIRDILNTEFLSNEQKTLILYKIPGIMAKRIILVKLGNKSDYSMKIHANAEEEFAQACVNIKVSEGVSTFLLNAHNRNIRDYARISAISIGKSIYFYSLTFSKEHFNLKPKLKKITQLINTIDDHEVNIGLQEGNAIASGMELSRTLGDLPSNICTPSYLCKEALKLEQESDLIRVQIIDHDKIKSLGMNSFLSVARGSNEAPFLIVLRYKSQEQEKSDIGPTILVGKGVTFDSGGISIKASNHMDEMKYDMCGAASVLGTFHALKKLKLPQEIIGIIPTCENLPSGKANKPGDIVTSMSGQTIEILNTDAEGRLLLCDALTYVKRFSPEVVIDIATLTGACVVALGNVNSGLFSKDSYLSNDLIKAGKQIMDPVWQMPMDDDYQTQLESNFADIANIGNSSGAGSVTAACFLSRFTSSYRWAHLDIAGTAWTKGKNKGSTGRPVPMLLQFLLNQAEQRRKKL